MKSSELSAHLKTRDACS